MAILATPATADVLDPLTATQRHQEAADYRVDRANANFNNPPAQHPTNGDEYGVANFAGQFHKTLPHNNQGVVDPAAYNNLRVVG